MAELVNIRDTSGQDQVVNLDHVVMITPAGPGGMIFLSNGHHISTQALPSQIAQLPRLTSSRGS